MALIKVLHKKEEWQSLLRNFGYVNVRKIEKRLRDHPFQTLIMVYRYPSGGIIIGMHSNWTDCIAVERQMHSRLLSIFILPEWTEYVINDS